MGWNKWCQQLCLVMKPLTQFERRSANLSQHSLENICSLLGYFPELCSFSKAIQSVISSYLTQISHLSVMKNYLQTATWRMLICKTLRPNCVLPVGVQRVSFHYFSSTKVSCLLCKRTFPVQQKCKGVLTKNFGVRYHVLCWKVRQNDFSENQRQG